MKNEQKFKQRIAEVAAKIAEGAYEEEGEVKKPKEEMDEMDQETKETPDAARIKAILDQVKRLEPAFKAINSASEVRDVIKDIVGMMSNPDLSDANKRSGLNLVLTGLAKSAMAAKSGDVPEVPAADKKDMGLPQLQEAFNRINRK
jgi:hypothetical protein